MMMSTNFILTTLWGNRRRRLTDEWQLTINTTWNTNTFLFADDLALIQCKEWPRKINVAMENLCNKYILEILHNKTKVITFKGIEGNYPEKKKIIVIDEPIEQIHNYQMIATAIIVTEQIRYISSNKYIRNKI